MTGKQQVNIRLSDADIGLLSALTEQTGLSQAEVVAKLLQSGADNLNLQLATGEKNPKLQADAPKRVNTSGKFRSKIELVESGGKFWPQRTFVPFAEWQAGQSYWDQDQNYRWSGNLDRDERDNAADFILGPTGGLCFSAVGPFQSTERYDFWLDFYNLRAQQIVTFWFGALFQVIDAEAQENKLYPVKTTDPLVNQCAAWMQYVREHPGLSQEQNRRVIAAIGLVPNDELAIREALTMNYTQRNGYLVADYPWYGF